MGWWNVSQFGIVTVMLEGDFTTRAAVLWATIPKEARERILENVWCGECGDTVQMIKITGGEENGDVILRGNCASCGNVVVRVVETSERDSSGN